MFRWHLSIDELRSRAPLFQRTAVAVGNFDGVHIGHAHILRLAIRHAAPAGETPIALTFDPHPRAVIGSGAPPALATPAERDGLIRDLGMAAVVSLHFDKDVAALPPDQFVRTVLVDGLGAHRIVVGDNFRFGRGAQGTTRLLRDMGQQYGFDVHVAETVRGPDGEVVSSSVIRRLLAAGDVESAARLLNRPYGVVGRVSASDEFAGSTGGPSFRVEPIDGLLLPGNGVYEALFTLDEINARWLPAVAVTGPSPTDSGDGGILLVQLPDFTGDVVGRLVRVRFLGQRR